MAVFALQWPYLEVKMAEISLRDQKLAVLRLLGQESEPIGMAEILHKLGEGFKERSVRRWLNLLVTEGSVRRMGQKRGFR